MPAFQVKALSGTGDFDFFLGICLENLIKSLQKVRKMGKGLQFLQG
jgi:hypothetical protein